MMGLDDPVRSYISTMSPTPTVVLAHAESCAIPWRHAFATVSIEEISFLCVVQHFIRRSGKTEISRTIFGLVKMNVKNSHGGLLQTVS